MLRLCEAVGYAHARGVTHRDLKPENVMVGDFGEVLVMDWGLAKLLGAAARPGRADPPGGGHIASDRSEDAALRTRLGTVAGTPAWMAPEQARGQVERLGPRTDVFALGAILYATLYGRPPFVDPDPAVIIRRIAGGERAELAPLPAALEGLDRICRRALHPHAIARHADASALGDDIRSWLEGARRRERAELLIARARDHEPRILQLTAEARELRERAEEAQAALRPLDPEEQKAAAWALEDGAAARTQAAEIARTELHQFLRAALAEVPDHPVANRLLADHYRDEHAQAELARDHAAAGRLEVLLRAHGHTTHAAYLSGEGQLTLHTDPPGATATLLRYELRRRRLVPTPVRELGQTPIERVPLPHGSYLVELRHPDREPVRVPVSIRREEHWTNTPPGGASPHPIHLPPAGTLGPDDCYVPAGWGWSGGDPEVFDPLPRRRLWVDSLVIARYPVTNRDYIEFLDALVADGREEEALRHAPREPAAAAGEQREPIYGRDEAGRFVLRPDAQGDLWLPDYPVLLVDWFDAHAYASWRAQRDGLPWRLPASLEWERAARGVDARVFPWGDTLDPTWTNCREGRSRSELRLEVVDSYPVDESPYGVRGLAGNLRDWCLDPYRSEGGPVDDADRVLIVDPGFGDAPRVRRGGSWVSPAHLGRACARAMNSPDERYTFLGFRVARSLGPPAG